MRCVILGSGEVGVHLARVLAAAGMEIVLVDRDPSALAAAEERIDALTMVGDATHWSVLERARVVGAGLVVAVTGADEVNLVAAGLAAQLGAPRAVARADASGLYRSAAAIETAVLGVPFVLCASRLLSHELLRMLRARSASYVGDFAAHSVRVCVVELDDESAAIGQEAAGLKHAAAEHTAAVIRDGVLRPLVEITRLELGDRLLLVGPPDAVAESQYKLLDVYRKHRVVLIGGGDVGAQLARELSHTARHVQIIERDPNRCRALSEQIPGATVIEGDGTSIALLRDQQVDRADAVLATTKSDDANLMASLLARDLGVPNTFAIVHRHGYADVYAHLGVSGTVGPHDAIANMVSSLLPRDGVLQTQKLPDCSHELVEYQLDATISSAVTLASLVLPPGCVLLALARNHTFEPIKPRMSLRPYDHVVIAQPLHASREVRKRIAQLAGGRG